MRATIAMVCLVVGLLVTPNATPAQELEPILETYTIGHGGDSGAGGLTAVLRDRNLGNGTAEAHIVFSPTDIGSQLVLKVTRRVRPGEFTFALLVFRVEIRGQGSEGELLYSRDLDGFTFGDSSSGRWFERLRDLPTGIAQLTISFVGNYE